MKSMKFNAFLTTFRTVLSLIIPLITFPYITKVLAIEEIGTFNFSNSIISYFILIAGLGINTYAIREGAKVRDDIIKFKSFASEMYFFNICSTIFAYIILLLLLLSVEKFSSYKIIILILSSTLVLNCFSRQWVFNVYEDFLTITVLQIFFQVLSIVAIFLFVKSKGDVNIYSLIYVLSTSGPYFVYGILSRKYVKISLKSVSLSAVKKHCKPIMIIFGMAIATTIYVNSDMTILGFITDDYTVGIYSTAVKVYKIVKSVLVAVITVTIPRLTLYAGSAKYKILFKKVFDSLIVLTIPAVTGVFMLSKDIILIIANESYISSADTLRILCFAIVFALFANLFGTCVLLPYNKEMIFLVATIISAVLNILLNFILIPIWGANAAAFATAVSQGIVLIIHYIYSKQYIQIRSSIKCICKSVLGSVLIILVCYFVMKLKLSVFAEIVLSIVVSVFIYGISQIVLKNEIVISLLDSVITYIKKLGYRFNS